MVYRIRVTDSVYDGCNGAETYTRYLDTVYGSRDAATRDKKELEAIQDENNERILHTSLPFERAKYDVVEQELVW